MSYQVLARKWRPGKFSELVGQEHVVSAISNALDNDRLHHAYLFTGTRGVGKTTIARIFSKSLNCEEGQGANPCGQCNTCKEIEQGNYVDLLEIDAASRTKVEDTRELLDNVQYKPTRGRYKVYLIDEVHMLSKHSFNALLKTLEEPPPHVKFLLATTDPQKLPITILSRCLQFNLKAMSREQIVGQLTHILQQEQLAFEAPALALLARAAQGSMRDALSLTDQAIAQGGNRVMASVVTDMLGLMDKNQLLKVIHAVVNKSPAEVLQLVNDIAEQAPDYDNVHSELASLLHQIALTQWVPEACKLETTSAKAIFQLAKTISAEQVQLLYQIALQGRKDLPFAADGKSAFEMTLMRMMAFAPNAPIAETVDEIENGRSEHNLPVNHASPSGGPGNVSKQEEPPLSETSATIDQGEAQIEAQPEHEPTSPKTPPQTPIADASTDLLSSAPAETVANEEEPTAVSNTQTDTAAETDIAFEANLSSASASEAQEPQSNASVEDEEASPVAQYFDEPPLDAYMDDMPPLQDESGHYELDTPESERIVEPSPSAEEQLTSTADMLALRQKLKQKKAQDADAKSSSAANAKTQSASEIQARFTRSKTDAASTVADEKNSPEPINSPELSNSPEPINSPALEAAPESEQSQDSITAHQSANALNDGSDTQLLGGSEQASTNADFADNNDSGHDAFALDDFEEDMPFSNDESDANYNPNPQVEDAPPWDTGKSVQGGHSVEPSLTPVPRANELESKEHGFYERGENAGERSFTRDALDFDTPLSTTYEGSLQAYLSDGSKLTHASQIDDWSNLVEQMPVAGLLKQLVLHAAFSRNGNHVSLEIHHSQTHLLKDSAKKQLVDAIHHGLGENVEVSITLGEPSSTPFALQQEIHAMRHAHAHSVIKTDETIQALLSTFDGSVLTDTVKAR